MYVLVFKINTECHCCCFCLCYPMFRDIPVTNLCLHPRCKMWSMLPIMASAIAPCWVKALDFAIFCGGWADMGISEVGLMPYTHIYPPFFWGNVDATIWRSCLLSAKVIIASFRGSTSSRYQKQKDCTQFKMTWNYM